jgi:hypothetical protein
MQQLGAGVWLFSCSTLVCGVSFFGIIGVFAGVVWLAVVWSGAFLLKQTLVLDHGFVSVQFGCTHSSLNVGGRNKFVPLSKTLSGRGRTTPTTS